MPANKGPVMAEAKEVPVGELGDAKGQAFFQVKIFEVEEEWFRVSHG
jgi:hypothetical protein